MSYPHAPANASTPPPHAAAAAPAPASGGVRTPTFPRDVLVRLCNHSDPQVSDWALQRLGPDDALLDMLSADANLAAAAAHHLLEAHWCPDPEAVRSVWSAVPTEWRGVVAALAARAGCTDLAREWADQYQGADDWGSVALRLWTLSPALLAEAAAARAHDATSDGAVRSDDHTLTAAAVHDDSRMLARLNAVWHGTADAASELARVLMVRRGMNSLASWEWSSTRRPRTDRPQPLHDGRAPFGHALFGRWSSPLPAPWDLHAPPNGVAAARSAIRDLLARLPTAIPGLGPDAAAIFRARMRCLQMMAEAPLPGIVGVRAVGLNRPDRNAWWLGAALYAAVAHTVDWWTPMTPVTGDAASPAPVPRPRVRLAVEPGSPQEALELLSCAFGDPPSAHLVRAAAQGEAFVTALLDAAAYLGVATAANIAHPTVQPPLPPPGAGLAQPASLPEALMAAAAWLSRHQAALSTPDAHRLLDVASRLWPDDQELAGFVALARRAPAEAAKAWLQEVHPSNAPVADAPWPDRPDPEQRARVNRRLFAGFFLADRLEEPAAHALAEVLPQLRADGEVWPEIARVALGAAGPVLPSLLACWRPGDHEMGGILDALGRIAEAAADAPPGIAEAPAATIVAAHPPADSDPLSLLAHVREDLRNGPAWAHAAADPYVATGDLLSDGVDAPLRVALACVACGEVHVYDVTTVNACPEPRGSFAEAATVPGAPEGVRAAPSAGRARRRNPVFLWPARDLIPGPRFRCRACGAEGRFRNTVAGVQCMTAYIRRAEEGRGDEDTDEVRLRWREPLVSRDMVLSMSDLVRQAEDRLAASEADADDLLLLGSFWATGGDIPAARALAERAEAQFGRTDEVISICTAIAAAEQDVAGLASLLQESNALPEGDDDGGATLAQIANRWAPAGGKVGRNDPCPCGSGKKYKRCCGAAG